MRANLIVAGSSRETGALLKEYLEDRGVTLTSRAELTISYGIRRPGALGGSCGAGFETGEGKLYNMRVMNENGVRTVPYFKGDVVPRGARFPLLARKLHGYGGKDLVPVFQPEEIPWRLAAGWEWFSSFVPIDQEYRVWTFNHKDRRGVETLGTYKKVMRRPGDFTSIGRNFGNGFDFEKTKDEAEVSEIAQAATACLNLDFSAVDLLRGKDGLLYILECNTAPGAIRSGAQATLGKLADRMVDWVRARS